MAAYTHLSLEERISLQVCIEQGYSKASISRILRRNPSTIAKEIWRNRTLKPATHNLAADCAIYKYCTKGRQSCETCPDFVPFACSRRDHLPGVCNGCSNIRKCRFTKFFYKASLAHKSYRKSLVGTRKGLDLNWDDVTRLARTIVPLIKQGQSPYIVISSHPELGLCEKTLYNYIDRNVFAPFGLLNIDLRQKTKRRISKPDVDPTFKKRANRKFLVGRTFEDYMAFTARYGHSKQVQMDTVYNRSEGPFLQIFKFLDYDFMLAFIHPEKTAKAMNDGVKRLHDLMGHKLFTQEVKLILTDRGPEFSSPCDMERFGTRVFYCDAMSPGQKGSLEKRHTELRYILPKHRSFDALGLKGQAELNLVLSHLNSYPRQKHHHKTPFELLTFLCEPFKLCCQNFGIREIERDMVTLKPCLLS